MMRSRSLIWLFALVLVVAAASRIAVGVWWQARLPQDTIFFFGDSHSYWSLARAIALGEPYIYGELRVFRSPGVPLLLSPLFWLAGGDVAPLWGRGVVALAGTASVAATFLLGRVLFNARVGLAAAAIMAVYPTNVFLGGMVLSEAPFAAAMVLQLACWIAAWQRRTELRASLPWAAAAGVSAAAATLIRPSWLLFLPLALLLSLLLCGERRRHVQIGALVLAAFIVTMTPWWVRNFQVTGRFVPTTLQVGASLYDGLHPAADGGSDMEFVEPLTESYRTDWNKLPAPRPEWEVYLDGRFRRDAVTWARQHPRRAVELAGVKFLRTWNVWPNADEFGATWMRLLLFATYTPLMILALLGVWRFRRLGWPVLLCCLPAVYAALLHVVFVGSIRYREPALMPLAVLAAAWLMSHFGGKDARHFSAND
ncbi:MAG: glycosyltransferase family 39 protein [Pirellulales bacterium]